MNSGPRQVSAKQFFRDLGDLATLVAGALQFVPSGPTRAIAVATIVAP
jgi:hypothetical protein